MAVPRLVTSSNTANASTPRVSQRSCPREAGRSGRQRRSMSRRTVVPTPSTKPEAVPTAAISRVAKATPPKAGGRCSMMNVGRASELSISGRLRRMNMPTATPSRPRGGIRAALIRAPLRAARRSRAEKTACR